MLFFLPSSSRPRRRRLALGAAVLGGVAAQVAVAQARQPYVTEVMRDYCLCRSKETEAVGLGDVFLPKSCEVDAARLEAVAAATPPQLTVVVMAYLPALAWRLEKLLCGYARAYAVIRRVVVLWNGPRTEPPNATCAVDWRTHRLGRRASALLESGRAYRHRRVELEVIVEERNTLLNRYRHADRVPTDVVLLQDDDVVHSPAALRAFAFFPLALPNQILGTPPERDYTLATTESPGGGGDAAGALEGKSTSTREEGSAPHDQHAYAYVHHPRGGAYSFLLGQTSVLRTSYLDDFLTNAPRRSLKFIVTHKPTCEDLTLHFHVANATGLPPAVFHDLRPRMIAGPRGAQMHSSGSKKIWNKRRERCLDRLVDDFHHVMPLVKSTCRLTGNISIFDPIYRSAYSGAAARIRAGAASSSGRGVDDDLTTVPMARVRRRRRKKEQSSSAEDLAQQQDDDDDDTNAAFGEQQASPVV